MIEAEKIKASLKERELTVKAILDERRAAIDNQMKALEFAARDDLERDKLVQQLEIAKASQQTQRVINDSKIKADQEAQRVAPYDAPEAAPLTPPNVQ